MIIDCISDLHGNYPTLDGGDLLIVAGDLTARDTPYERLEFLEWLANQEYKRKIFIAGNHDNSLINQSFTKTRNDGVDYLCDSGTEFEYEEPVRNLFDPNDESLFFKKKLKIWGSPWTLTFPGINPKCTAFTGDEELLASKFALIPDDVDILITHGPPFTILDKTNRGEQVGSINLMAHHLKRLRPRLFVFGHIHEAYGQEGPHQWNNTKYVNCSHVNEHYEPVNKPIRIIL